MLLVLQLAIIGGGDLHAALVAEVVHQEAVEQHFGAVEPVFGVQAFGLLRQRITGGVHARLGFFGEENGVAEQYGLQALEAHGQAVLLLGIAERLGQILVGDAVDDEDAVRCNQHPCALDAELFEVHPDGAVLAHSDIGAEGLAGILVVVSDFGLGRKPLGAHRVFEQFFHQNVFALRLQRSALRLAEALAGGYCEKQSQQQQKMDCVLQGQMIYNKDAKLRHLVTA